MTCIDDENKTDNVYLAVHQATQDADMDGFPDEGEAPFFCVGPESFSTAKRVPQFPSCEPGPPPD